MMHPVRWLVLFCAFLVLSWLLFALFSLFIYQLPVRVIFTVLFLDDEDGKPKGRGCLSSRWTEVGTVVAGINRKLSSTTKTCLISFKYYRLEKYLSNMSSPPTICLRKVHEIPLFCLSIWDYSIVGKLTFFC
jgi:hypothetical protein